MELQRLSLSRSISATCHLGITSWRSAAEPPPGASTRSFWTNKEGTMGCRLMRHQIRGHRVAGSPLDWPTKRRASPRPGVKRTTGIHEITGLAIALVILASAIGNAHAQTAADLLAEADRLAWLKNWSRAEPLFSRAEEMFSAAGDERNALYSRISSRPVLQ